MSQIDLARSFDSAVDVAEIPTGLKVKQDRCDCFESLTQGVNGTGDKEAVEEKGGESVPRFPEVEMAGAR